MSDLTIGKLAARTGCNVETIRYYERIGLLAEPPRSAGGHRLYDDDAARRLAFIRRSRELGFPLDEVQTLLRHADAEDQSCTEIRTIAVGHLAEVRRKLADLRRLERALVEMIAECESGSVPSCPILDALSD